MSLIFVYDFGNHFNNIWLHTIDMLEFFTLYGGSCTSFIIKFSLSSSSFSKYYYNHYFVVYVFFILLKRSYFQLYPKFCCGVIRSWLAKFQKTNFHLFDASILQKKIHQTNRNYLSHTKRNNAKKNCTTIYESQNG